ncbi:MAG TPA: hypothetical protein VFT21_03215 [Gemmatimonadaceae bacterium]|nr:hypothetical protein [Gemmatimonadaceae bacterium]
MEGRYEIGYEHVRTLAIQCHALDTDFDRLFNERTVEDKYELTYRTFNRLFSTSLLNLAISIRVSLAKEPEYKEAGRVTPAVLLLEGQPPKAGEFSIKDICDKLIHAGSITKPIEPGTRGAACELTGTQWGETWKIGLGVEIFSNYILEWMDVLAWRYNGLDLDAP